MVDFVELGWVGWLVGWVELAWVGWVGLGWDC